MRGIGGGPGVAQFSVSMNGSLVYISGPTTVSDANLGLALVDREGRAELLGVQNGQYSVPRVSPDGKEVAVQTDDGKEPIIWIYDIDGKTSLRRLPFGGRNRFPVWSPDSKWIAFQSDREGDAAIFQQRADGAGTAERLTRPEAGTTHVPDSWSPNGEALLIEVTKDKTISLSALSMRDRKTTTFENVQSSIPIDATFSPDGRFVAYTSNETGNDEVFVQPFPATGAKYQVTKGHAPVFSRDGKELLYIPNPGRYSVVNVTMQSSFSASNPIDVFLGPRSANPPGSRRNFDLMPDGKHVVNPGPADQIRNGGTIHSQFEVVTNWVEELKQRVPTH
jgi:Tol biopolymer transport system component